MAKPKNKPHKVSLVDSDLSPNLVDEGAASGTEVGITASATFKHAKGPVIYSLTDDVGGAFTIDPLSGVVTVANGTLLDYETAPSQTITVSVTDGKVSAVQSFDVAIGDVAEITVQRVSMASDGTEGDGHSSSPAISADGRYVAYTSLASNLVPGDTNGSFDVFVFDRETGITERVGDGSTNPEISADGRYVAYLGPGLNPGGFEEIFVFDRQTGTTERVASDDAGTGDLSSAHPAISADGRYVAYANDFSSPGGEGPRGHVFVFDRQTGATEIVTHTGTDGYGASPAISADGRYVTYDGNVGDTNGSSDVFVIDRQAGTTERVSVASDGTEGNGGSTHPAISADGRYIAYQSSASNLVAGDTNDAEDIFVFDRQTGTTERVSVASDGTQGWSGDSYSPSISADGRYVTYESVASTLVPGDTNGSSDVFVFDRQAGTTERVSVASDGTEGNGVSAGSAISADGRYVAYGSSASNLVAGDTNNANDVFVVETHDLLLI